jgi:LysM repeat protein
MNTQHKKVLIITAAVFFHVAVITLMLVQPGCKSDGAKASAPESAPPAVVAAPAPIPAPVAADNSFVSPTRPPPETPVAPIPAGQYSEPLTSELPAPAPVSAPSTPAVTWVVAKGDSLTSIAKKNGITVDELVSANAPKLTKTSVIHVGQSLAVPAQSSSAQTSATPSASTSEDGSVYTVKSGDTLSKIAQKNGTTVAALKSLNKLSSSGIVRVGQKLKLPARSSPSATPTASTAVAASATVDTSSGEYTVAPGDSLSKIASKTGTKVSELMSVNNLTDATARTLHPGQKLKLPSNANTPAASAPATPTVVTAAPSLFQLTPETPSNVTGVPSATTTAPITPVQ